MRLLHRHHSIREPNAMALIFTYSLASIGDAESQNSPTTFRFA